MRSVGLSAGRRVPFAALVWVAVLTGTARAADRDDVERAVAAMQGRLGADLRIERSAASGTVVFLAAPEGKAMPVPGAPTGPAKDRALAFLRENAVAFGLGKSSDLQTVRAEAGDDLGFEHVRLQQTHRGVPVTGAELTVHLRDAGVVAVLAKTVPGLESLDVVPRVTPEAADRAAREGVAKDLAKAVRGASPPRLEVLNRGLLEGGLGPSRLAWFVEVTGEGLRDFAWIDAQRGATLLRFSQLPEARVRQVFTANSSPTLPGTLVRSEGQPASGDVDADAAYDGAGDAYDYFMNQHGRDSFDGAGSPILSTVDFCPAGAPCPYPNAAWTGTQMVYGDGFSVADDVAAHELTHAVIQHTANLFYYMQSGALNESIADIFGETIDLSNGRGNDDPSVRWLMGEDVPGLGAVRNMSNPNQFGDAAWAADNLMVCTNADNGGVHSNSGVPNHAFALMVDGGSYQGVTVTGIGLQKAGKVVYRALAHYLTSASNLGDFSRAASQACGDLVGSYGFNSDHCSQVAAAMAAVAMEGSLCGSHWSREPPRVMCDITEAPLFLFEDNLENLASGNWTTGYSEGGNHWTEGAGVPDVYFSGFATSGQWSFWGFGAALPGDSWVAMSRGVDLPPKSYLSFRHSFGFEQGYDGGLLEYSANGGAWVALPRNGPPPHPQPLARGTGNPLGGQWGFTGLSFGYVNDLTPLDAFQGTNIRFRFRIGTDFGGSDIGWFIDDVKIYACMRRVSLSVTGARVREGDAGTTAAVFTAELESNPYNVPAAVEYAAASGPYDAATPGVDFVPTSGRITFPPGVLRRTISVPVLGDRVAEVDELVQLELRKAEFLGYYPVWATAVIENDDAEGFTVTDVAVVEPAAGTVDALFEVAVTPPGTSASVSFKTTDGTASSPGDYTSTTGTLSFDAVNDRRQVAVPVKASGSSTSPRTFHVDLFGSTGPAIARPRGTASIYERGLHLVTPCRLFDTRQPQHGPPLAAGSTRSVVVGSGCALPPTATAVALNLTIVQPATPGHLTVYPSGTPRPATSTVNFTAGQTRANNAVVPLGPDGRLEVALSNGEADFIVDVTGFFE